MGDIKGIESTEGGLSLAPWGSAEGQRMRWLLQAVPDATALVDPSGRIVTANSQFEQLFGYTGLELVGRPVDDLVPEEFRPAHLTHRRWYADNPHPRPMGQGRDLCARRSDGVEFAAEISLSSLPTPDGVLVTVAVRDVSERRRVEDRFHGLVESAPDAMVITEPDGTIVLVNAQTESLFGYQRAELLGAKIEILVPEKFRAIHPQHRAGYVAVPGTRSMGIGLELSGRRKDGSQFPVEISLSTLEVDGGMLVSSSIRDITERKKTEVALLAAKSAAESAGAAFEAFSYSVAHDLRAPLRAIDGFSGALAEEYAHLFDATALEYLARVRGSAQRMAQLIDSLLTLARVTHREFDAISVDLSALARSALARLAEEDPGREVETVIQSGLTTIGDATLLANALQNLLSNAWKFTRHRPVGRIEFGRDGAGYFVRDNGAGFDMAYSAKLFGVFQRLHSPQDFDGTGIGLATVQRVVQRHGGRIWAESILDHGATFHFTLPERMA